MTRDLISNNNIKIPNALKLDPDCGVSFISLYEDILDGHNTDTIGKLLF